MALVVFSTAAGAQEVRQELGPGATIERRMAGGETHSYAVEAGPGARLRVVVDQRGIDVAVEALRPDGSVLIAVDGPTDRDGPVADQDKDVICRDLQLSDLHFNRVLFRARQRYKELFEKWQETR